MSGSPMCAHPTLPVLVADDNRFNRAIVTHLLTQLGVPCLEADSGEAALALLAQQQVGLLLLDLRMPGMRGEAVCARLRAEPAFAGLRVVAFTAHRMAHEAQALREAGFDGILVKPPSLHDLRALCAIHLPPCPPPAA